LGGSFNSVGVTATGGALLVEAGWLHLLAIFEHGEVRLLETMHRLALRVRHNHIDDGQRHARLDGVLRLAGVLCQSGWSGGKT
jgi:hypothetical protein